MLAELGAAFGRAADDHAVVALTGREGVFSAVSLVRCRVRQVGSVTEPLVEAADAPGRELVKPRSRGPSALAGGHVAASVWPGYR
jgi:hypothetical protein